MILYEFSSEVAKECGVNAAVLLSQIYLDVEHNAANNVNYHDGHYWTSCSVKAFSKMLPFLSNRQIEAGLKKLKEAGLIIDGKYNELPFDQTKWYSITERGYALLAS